jgi:hypothetical protein
MIDLSSRCSAGWAHDVRQASPLRRVGLRMQPCYGLNAVGSLCRGGRLATVPRATEGRDGYEHRRKDCRPDHSVVPAPRRSRRIVRCGRRHSLIVMWWDPAWRHVAARKNSGTQLPPHHQRVDTTSHKSFGVDRTETTGAEFSWLSHASCCASSERGDRTPSYY